MEQEFQEEIKAFLKDKVVENINTNGMTKIKKDEDLKYFERIQRNNLIDRVKTKSIPKNKVYKTKTDKKISKQKISVDKKKKRVAKELLTEDKKMTSKYSKLKKIVGSNKSVAKKRSK